MRKIQNTQDWLEGFYYGKQAGIEEVIKMSMPFLKEMDKNLDSSTSVLDNIREHTDSVMNKLRNIL